MEIALIIAIVGLTNMCAFIKGAQIGQKVANKEEIKLPEINPIKAVEQKKLTKDQQKEIDKFNALMDNIDNYDGTGANQKEV